MPPRSPRVSTNTLMRRLFKADSISEALQQNEASMQVETVSMVLNRLCRERDLVPERVIREAEIDRTYGHQIFNGRRNPSRDKILQLAFGMHLSVDETQKLLQAAGKSPLYPRIRRDAVLLYCLNKSMRVLDVQSTLAGCDITILGGASAYED